MFRAADGLSVIQSGNQNDIDQTSEVLKTSEVSPEIKVILIAKVN
jgi:hypothetical protein